MDEKYNKNEWVNATGAYVAYIEQHKVDIRSAWETLKAALCGIGLFNRYEIMDAMENRIFCHDDSKMTEEEFLPYRQKFYPIPNEQFDEKSFDDAWFTHYNRNDHHWQHWVREDGSFVKIYDISVKICAYLEMICDWQAMGDAYKYYNENKDVIILDPEWIPFIEEVLNCLHEYLDSKEVCIDV